MVKKFKLIENCLNSFKMSKYPIKIENQQIAKYPLTTPFKIYKILRTKTTPNGKKIKKIENCLNNLKLSKHSMTNKKSTNNKTTPFKINN